MSDESNNTRKIKAILYILERFSPYKPNEFYPDDEQYILPIKNKFEDYLEEGLRLNELGDSFYNLTIGCDVKKGEGGNFVITPKAGSGVTVAGITQKAEGGKLQGVVEVVSEDDKSVTIKAKTPFANVCLSFDAGLSKSGTKFLDSLTEMLNTGHRTTTQLSGWEKEEMYDKKIIPIEVKDPTTSLFNILPSVLIDPEPTGARHHKHGEPSQVKGLE